MTTVPTFTAFPDPPTRSDPSNFDTKAEAVLVALEEDFVPEAQAFVTAVNTVSSEINTAKTASETAQTAAETAQGLAETAQTAAESSANATLYDSGKVGGYSIGDVVFSSIGKTYRCIQDQAEGAVIALSNTAYWYAFGSVNDSISKTADYTMILTDLGGIKTFNNSGASGAVEFTLPAGVDGMVGKFRVSAARYLKVTTDGTEKFRYMTETGAAGGYIRSNAIGTVVDIEFVGGEWYITRLIGSISYDE